MNNRRMILCAGPQSSGSTLISWCFLQHGSISGELDMPAETMRIDFDSYGTPWIWNKMTISSFRWLEAAKLYEDLGWTVYPLLIVRDVRPTFASLMRKEWGINSNTADDPPLRIRFRRFLQDWEQFQRQQWPFIKFEQFLTDPVETLKQACLQLGIEWDDGMVYWKKAQEDIFTRDTYNTTFSKSIKDKKSILDAVQPNNVYDCTGLSEKDLKWIEREFLEYNRSLGYVQKLTNSKERFPAKESLAINPEAARRVLQQREHQELRGRISELQRKLRQLQDRFNLLQSEHNRLKEMRAVHFARWLESHPRILAACTFGYDKTIGLLRKNEPKRGDHGRREK